MHYKIAIFAAYTSVLAAAFFVPVSALIRSSLHAGYSSHIILIPFIAAYLIYTERIKIFANVQPSSAVGTLLGVLGVLCTIGAFVIAPQVQATIVPFLTVLSALLLLVSGFVFVFGVNALKQALFPFLLLLLVLPVPGAVVDWLIHFLQSGSAHLSAWIFSALGVPVLQNGFQLTVPGVTIEVAEECSGINSSIALFIVALLFAHETLSTNSRRAFLVALVLPISILKNGIRIVTLTLLATKVDPGFLTGRLHHEGGFVFFAVTLALVYPIWRLLRSSEERKLRPARAEAGAAPASVVNL